jgi:hypothetical protein
MTETYCVVAQVSGFATERDVTNASFAGRSFDKDEHNELLLKPLRQNLDCEVADVMIRDDGTGEVAVVWKPEAEADGTMTWHNAKDSVEAVRSAVAGAGLAALNPVKIELRETAPVKPKSKTAAKASPASATNDADRRREASSKK